MRVGKGAGYSSNTCAEVRTLPSSSVVPQSSGWWRDCSPVQHPVQTVRPHTCSGKGEDTMAGEGGIGYSISSFCDNSQYKICKVPKMCMHGFHEGKLLLIQRETFKGEKLLQISRFCGYS